MTRSKCILFTLVHLGVGGAQKIASLVMNQLIDAGFRVAVCCYYSETEHVHLSDKVNRLYLFESYSEYEVSGFQRLLVKLKTISRYRSAITKLNPDCIVSFGPDALLFLACKSAAYRGRFVCCERGDASKRNFLYRRILKAEMSSSDRGVFQFPGAMSPYSSSLPADTRIIANPCLRTLSSTRDISNLKNEIAGAGRLVADKGFDTLIQAFSIIADNYDIDLVIYGEGPDRSRLEDLVNSLGLEGRVMLPGAVSNVAEQVQSALLFVLSSQYEGCPNTLIEAMCAGVPVVATDCSPGGARFLTHGGEIGGPIVPVGDSGAMAEAISWMLDNQEKAEELGRLGTSLLDDYQTEKILNMWIDLFKGLFDETESTREGGACVDMSWLKGLRNSFWCRYLLDANFRIQMEINRSTSARRGSHRANWLANRLMLKRGIFISPGAVLGSHVLFPHPTGIVIGNGVVVGDYSVIYQDVTLGQERGQYPELGNRVTVYAGAKIIGNVYVGDNAVIGANAVVVKDVPANAIVAGVPARIIRICGKE